MPVIDWIFNNRPAIVIFFSLVGIIGHHFVMKRNKNLPPPPKDEDGW